MHRVREWIEHNAWGQPVQQPGLVNPVIAPDVVQFQDGAFEALASRRVEKRPGFLSSFHNSFLFLHYTTLPHIIVNS